MQVNTLVDYLDHADAAAAWLRTLGVENVVRGHANLLDMARAGIPLDLLAGVCGRLAEQLPGVSDPGMALNNLDRFVAAAGNPLSLATLFERDREALPILLRIFSTSQHLSEVLIHDAGAYDVLRLTEGQPLARDVLVAELSGEVAALADQEAVLTALRRFKRRQTLRIAYGDIIRGQRIETVTRQISFVADAVCQAAVQAARRDVPPRRGTPRRSDGRPARLVVLGLGKLGGTELNYSSDIDLMFLYDEDGRTDGARPVSNHEFFGRVARSVVKLLSEMTGAGGLYRVDLRLRPEGRRGPMAVSLESARRYYDVLGRTWERQAMVKARAVAGDLELGRQFLAEMQPWIYRRYLSLTDIAGIKAVKRKIERQVLRDGADRLNVKTGRGGIRDIEFAIQFLQLLNGADRPNVRTGNTLAAIAALEREGCLTMQERSILEKNYAFLRKIEHRLQIMFDLQTHMLPDDDRELRKLAVRMDYTGPRALPTFKADYRHKTETNRKILDHLLHDAFGDDPETDPEVDLVLDPDPPHQTIRDVLGRYGFRDVDAAYRNLMDLTTEKVRFLSTRRCRHFLAAIAPKLLRAIASTPDPDSTLVNLSKVSDSLGGKGTLWELFSFNPPSLRLYVRLCGASPYLSDILVSHPGMIDELMDSLVLDKLPARRPMATILAELVRGAEDIDPILHSFKTSMHLRVGVRDILGKEDIRATHRALADCAEVCVEQITLREQERLAWKLGRPTIGDAPQSGRPCELVLLALGKLGGREPNYHSDLDVVFLYEADGTTRHPTAGRHPATTTNQHFFSRLGRRIIKVVTNLGPFGRLYELDARLRPTGTSGELAVSMDEFQRYFAEGKGRLWERQALCKARPIFGSPAARARAMKLVRTAIVGPGWKSENAAEIRAMRRRMEATASPRNLKRGPGGTVDIEFAVQALQIAHAARSAEVLVPGTLDALSALRRAGHLGEDDAEFFDRSYRFLRRVEARLRLLNTAARHDLPEDRRELEKLAYLLDYADADSLAADCRRYTAENRRRFERLLETVRVRR